MLRRAKGEICPELPESKHVKGKRRTLLLLEGKPENGPEGSGSALLDSLGFSLYLYFPLFCFLLNIGATSPFSVFLEVPEGEGVA